MPVFVPIIPFIRRRRRRRVLIAPAVLMLAAAEYEESEFITLTFDRPIDIAEFDAVQIVVDDVGLSGMRWVGVGPGTLTGPAMVQVQLETAGPATGAGTTLSAGAGTGIVAVDDGGAWGGVENIALPYP